MKKIIVLLISLMFSTGFSQENMLYKNSSQPIEDRIEDLLKRLTLDEKIELLGGTGFATKSITRLGIPELKMTDGPMGPRWNPSTAFPASVAMAATWNPELISKVGSAIARETKGKGRHVILGPCVNIVRMPMGGRNFESFGEDPFLTSRIAVDYIKGVQNEGIAATIKHLAVNNHEHERTFVDVIVSERALNEIYLPAFKAGVQEADVLCVMNSYNKINMNYAAEKDYLLVDKLKKEWGFSGLIMSDWDAVKSTIPTAKGGMDLEMPTGAYINNNSLKIPLQQGEITEVQITEKVRRILRVIFKLGLFDNPEWQENPELVNTKENRQIAYQTALESIVLLKNENNILPLNNNKFTKIAIIGPNAEIQRTGGGGSSYVTPIDPITPLQAIREKYSENIEINFEHGVILEGDTKGMEHEFLFTDKSLKTNGLQAKYWDNKFLEGNPKIERIESNVDFHWDDKSPEPTIPQDNFSARWSGFIKVPKSGEYQIQTSSDDGVRLYFDDKLIINDWNDHAVETKSYSVSLEKDAVHKITLEYYENGGAAVAILGWQKPQENQFEEAIKLAQNSDIVLIFAGNSDQIETEGRDRQNLELPSQQTELIQEITKVNKNVVVVLSTGAPIVMDKWLNDVEAVIQTWFSGTEGGNAIIDVLFGKYNPSGKLPISFPKKYEDASSFDTYKTYTARTYYSDDIYVGYRHFDKYNIEPLFPFGFGLSYTTFEYSNLSILEDENSFTVAFEIKNTGNVDGSEIAQIYVSAENPLVDRPIKELKSFKKVELKAKQKKLVELTIEKKSLSYFDGQIHDWKLDKGNYTIQVASSSKDIHLLKTVSIK